VVGWATRRAVTLTCVVGVHVASPPSPTALVVAVVAATLVSAFNNAREANDAAMQMANMGNYPAALQLFQKAMELAPHEPDYVCNAGVTVWAASAPPPPPSHPPPRGAPAMCSY
jgi:hypothetical protein